MPIRQNLPFAVKGPLEERNDLLDRLFYDVGAIAPAAAARLRRHRPSEGDLLIVAPDGCIVHHPSTEEFLDEAAGRAFALTVAGVGSSALGAAAFARNIAEAIDAPVAALVAGYGLNDALEEALGGWFYFRESVRFHRFKELTGMPSLTGARSPGRDMATLRALFTAERPAFDLIIGHSKGNLLVAEALYEALAINPARAATLLAGTHIVTMGAAIYMPEAASRVTDILGGYDWFGRLNSHPDVSIDLIIPGAGHHTNRALPFSLDASAALRTALQRAGAAPGNRPMNAKAAAPARKSATDKARATS